MCLDQLCGSEWELGRVGVGWRIVWCVAIGRGKTGKGNSVSIVWIFCIATSFFLKFIAFFHGNMRAVTSR